MNLVVLQQSILDKLQVPKDLKHLGKRIFFLQRKRSVNSGPLLRFWSSKVTEGVNAIFRRKKKSKCILVWFGVSSRLS